MVRYVFNQLYFPVSGLTILSYSRKQEFEVDKIGIVSDEPRYDAGEVSGF